MTIKIEIDGKIFEISKETEAQLVQQLCSKKIKLGCMKFRKYGGNFGLVIGENQILFWSKNDSMWKVILVHKQRLHHN